MSTFTEKDFYLDEFRGRTLVVSVGWRSLRGATVRRKLRSVVEDLIEHDARLLVVVGDCPGQGEATAAQRRWLGLPPTRVRRGLGARGAARRGDTVLWNPAEVDGSLARVWQVLRVDTEDAADCLAKFKSNRLFGWLVLAGIVAGRLVR